LSGIAERRWRSLLRPIRFSTYHFSLFAYHEESIFSPAYDRLRNKVRFLKSSIVGFQVQCLPVTRRSYLPTQAVVAYVSSAMGLDGTI
jgi:hypothetical protein